MSSSVNTPPKSSSPTGELPTESNFYKILAEAYQPTEFRSNVKLWGSGLLAISLWILVGSIAWNQLQANQDYAMRLANLKPKIEDGQISLLHQEQVQQIENLLRS